MHETNRTANLLGAAALALTDLLLSDATNAARTSTSGAAALVVLSADPGLSVTELGRRIGLSQPAAARMVDSMEASGLVERRPSMGRWVSVQLTEAGRGTAQHLLAARGGRLTAVVQRLDESDQTTLARLLSSLLEALYSEIGNADRMCRLCDRPACLANQAICPVGQAERDHRAGCLDG